MLRPSIYEAQYEMTDEIEVWAKLYSKLKNEPLENNPRLAQLYLRLLVDLKSTSMDELEQLVKKYSLDKHFEHQLKAQWLLHTGDIDQAKEEARKAGLVGESDWRDFCISTRILIIRKQFQLATAQAMAAAQRNPFTAELFGLLAESFSTTGNMEKAKGCIERARLLKPHNEGFAMLHDEILQKLVITCVTVDSRFSDSLVFVPIVLYSLQNSYSI